MSTDFEVEPGLTFGAWLRSEIEEAAFIERDGFFPEQVARVALRLQADRAPVERLGVVVPWFRVRSAFTAPGRYVYVSRGLLERCPHDEAVAFVLYLFHVLSLILLDAGDLDGVYGLDRESDQELSPEADLLTKARIRLYHLRRGYLPLQDREARVREHLASLRGDDAVG